MAGESARREYERRRTARKARVSRSWPLILVVVVAAFGAGWLLSVALASVAMSVPEAIASGGDVSISIHEPPLVVSLFLAAALALRVAVALLGPSRTERAWEKGAAGERLVGRALDALSDGHLQVLHDRRIPGSRANIDHIAVGPAGIFTVDAKQYSGKLEVRARGRELWIKGRNRSKLLEQALRQADVVRAQLARAGHDEVPVTPVLCFVGTQMPLLLAPKQAGGVLLTNPRGLRKRLIPRDVSFLGEAQAARVMAILDAALAPADLAVRRREEEGSPAPAADASASHEVAAPPLKQEPGSQPPSCDRCNEPMVVRTRRRDGVRFYGCSNFPNCRQTRQLVDAP
jgi:hypothetical protein